MCAWGRSSAPALCGARTSADRGSARCPSAERSAGGVFACAKRESALPDLAVQMLHHESDVGDDLTGGLHRLAIELPQAFAAHDLQGDVGAGRARVLLDL